MVPNEEKREAKSKVWYHYLAVKITLSALFRDIT